MRKVYVYSIFVILLLMLSGCINESAKTSDLKNSETTAPNRTVEKTIIYSGGDQTPYKTLEDLYNKAHSVIKGKVISSRVDYLSFRLDGNENDKEMTTIYTILVEEVYSNGDIAVGDKIELFQHGGETETTIMIYEDAVQLNDNAEYMMFLYQSMLYKNSYWLLNTLQGIYSLDENGEIIPGKDFSPTYEDLDKLKENAHK